MNNNATAKQSNSSNSSDQIALEKDNLNKRQQEEQQEYYAQNDSEEEFINQNLHYSFDKTVQELTDTLEPIGSDAFLNSQQAVAPSEDIAANDEGFSANEDSLDSGTSIDLYQGSKINSSTNHINLKPSLTGFDSGSENTNTDTDSVVEFDLAQNHINLNPQTTNVELGKAPVKQEEIVQEVITEEVNQAPTEITWDSLALSENDDGASMGILTTLDVDDDTHTYIVDDPRFEIVINDEGTALIKLKDGISLNYEEESSISFTVTATDSGGLSVSQEFVANVVDDTNEFNVSPVSDSDASINEISESASIGSSVGITAFATDADTGDIVTYSLSVNPNNAFAIDPNTGEVTIADPNQLDFETSQTMQIEVIASSDDSSSTQTFNVSVTDDRTEFSVSAISDTDASANAVSESASNGDVVGITAFASDGDASDAVSYSLSNDAGGAFTIDASTGVVTVADASQIDYESNTSMTIEVTATSDDGSTSTQSYSINVSDVNEAPTDMMFTGNSNLSMSVNNNIISANTIVADVASVVDVDAGDTHTFSLTDDANGKFTIDANTGEITLVSDHNVSSSYSDSVTVEVTDAAGNTYSEIVGINLGTSTGETISGSSNTDITYSLDGGDTLNGSSGDDVLYASDGITTIGASGSVGSSYSLIHLGNAADIDTREFNGTSENASDLLGSYGSAGSPLYNEIVNATANDTDGDNRVDDNDSGNSAETFTINGSDYAMDSTQVYDATVTFTDGTSGSFTAVIIQLDNGDVYMAPEYSANADSSLLESKPIESISLDTLIEDNTDLYADRLDSDYAVVDNGDTLNGGAGDDTLVSGGADDILNGEDGNDMFIFAEGNGTDTINGGAGGGWTDSIHLNDSSGGSNIGTYGTDWTLNLSEGSIQSSDASSIDLSDDADGQIVMQDGSTINFTEIERIEW